MARKRWLRVWLLTALSVLVVTTVSLACFRDLVPVRWATARLHRIAALVVPGLAAAQGVSANQDSQLLPRVAAAKPDRSMVSKWQDPHLVVLKFAEGTDIRLRNGAFVSPSGRFATSEVNKAISDASATARRQFSQSEEALDELRRGAERRHYRQQADLNLYFLLQVTDASRTLRLLDALNSQALVENSFARTFTTAPTPDFTSSQGYTDPAPGGLNSDHAQTEPGGDGSGSGPSNGVRIVDIEFNWTFNHEELLLPSSTLISGAQLSPHNEDEDHGTATLGLLVALDNGIGVTGMVPGASVRAAGVCRSANGQCADHDVAAAIVDATMHLLSEPVGAGVILIEQQSFWQSSFDRSWGAVPVEVEQDIYDAIVMAVDSGIAVVEPAGNGSLNLDTVRDPAGVHLFLRSVRDSGALIVGAGCPPSPPAVGCADRTALPITSYGSRLDFQGWGSDVTTTGYGDLSGNTPTNEYTDTYQGTSSASPMVAAAAMQGAFIVELGSPVDPVVLRSTMRIRATPQPAADAAVMPIGPRPNLDEVGVDVWERQLQAYFSAQEQSRLRIEFVLQPSYIPPPPICIPGPCEAAWVPPVDAFIRDGMLYLRYGIPGIDSVDAAALSTSAGRLKISGSLKRSETDVWRKASYHKFERTMTLPEDADASAARATFSEGSLEVKMPMW